MHCIIFNTATSMGQKRKRETIKYYFGGIEVSHRKMWSILIRSLKESGAIKNFNHIELIKIKNKETTFAQFLRTTNRDKLKGLEHFLVNYSDSILNMKKQIVINFLKANNLWAEYQKNIVQYNNSTLYPIDFDFTARFQRVLIFAWFRNDLINISFCWSDTPQGHYRWYDLDRTLTSMLDEIHIFKGDKTFSYEENISEIVAKAI